MLKIAGVTEGDLWLAPVPHKHPIPDKYVGIGDVVKLRGGGLPLTVVHVGAASETRPVRVNQMFSACESFCVEHDSLEPLSAEEMDYLRQVLSVERRLALLNVEGGRHG